LLQAALELAPEDGVQVESAADASEKLAALGRRMGVSGEGLLEDAMAPGTSLPDLVRIKEAAKVLVARAQQGDDRDAAVLLYLVAIAAALARDGIRISSQPTEDQRTRYQWLAARHAGFALGDLFRRAADRMRTTTTPYQPSAESDPFDNPPPSGGLPILPTS
jgi:hypothetical protein